MIESILSGNGVTDGVEWERGLGWAQPRAKRALWQIPDTARWLSHHGLPQVGLATGTLTAYHIKDGDSWRVVSMGTVYQKVQEVARFSRPRLESRPRGWERLISPRLAVLWGRGSCGPTERGMRIPWLAGGSGSKRPRLQLLPRG